MIPKRIYLRKEELNEQFMCERMVSCDASIGSCNVEYTDLSSLWHDASEEPKGNMDILFISKNGNVHKASNIDIQLYDWLKNINDIKKWAYINDLLPKGGGR